MSFKYGGKRDSFAAKQARPHPRGRIVINQAFRQTSEIAHGHTSTHNGSQPFRKSAFLGPFYDFVAPVFRPAGF